MTALDHEPHADRIFRAYLAATIRRTDRMFFWLLIGQWLVAVAIALSWSPRTWIAERWSWHEHVIAAVVLGALFAAYPLYCIVRTPGTALTRHVIAIGQMLQSALLVHVTGGRIETHFHVFGSLALLAFYRDWRVLITAALVVYSDHLALGILFPLSVYGVEEATVWRSLEHGFWVIFEVIFLAMSCRTGMRELSLIALRQAEIEQSKEELENRVHERTLSLTKAREEKITAEAANHAKNEFLSRMSHELRTPLNAILGFGQLLEMDNINQQQRECVEQINRGGKHLLGLINEVLDIARIEAGRIELSPEPVRVAHAFQEALELVRPLCADRNIKFEADLAGADGHYVLADNQKLKQVLLNLLSNAVKYNRAGGEVRLSCEEPCPDRLRLAVSDTGVGIRQEKLARMFIPFERLGAEQTGIEGSGLGLALSKSLVEVMGGTLTVNTVVGRGSRFVIDLPRAQVETELAQAVNELVRPEQSAPGDARTILYIEDNLDNLRLVQRIMARRPEVRLITAMQGSLGIDLARQHRPDLILLDVHLPDLSGAQVLDALKADSETQDIPVVVISADATARQIERLRAAGASDYLTKPIEVRRFLEIMDTILGGQRAHDPVQTS